MVKALRRRFVSWIGIALVLLNVVAPTVSHALHASNPQRLHEHRAWVLAVAGDWCVSVGPVAPADYAAIEAAVSIQRTLAALEACDFCTDPPLAGAAPLPPAPQLVAAPMVLGAVVFAAQAEILLRRPAFERPASRAPPLI